MLCKRVQFVLPEVRINEGNSGTLRNQPQAETILHVTSQEGNNQQVSEAFFLWKLTELIMHIEQRNKDKQATPEKAKSKRREKKYNKLRI